MPNVIRTAGMNYVSAKPLPLDLARQLSWTNKIVVVSFGSSASKLPDKAMAAFLEAFAQFPDYAFVWKLPNADKYTLPKNIIALPWLPQNDLMGDNRTKLFISHCGSNGIHEAFYHAVPIIGFPFFGDQPANAFNVETKGYGLYLDIKTVTGDQLAQAMRRVMNDENIKRRLQKVSCIIKERPLPSETVAKAIEHVMKYGGEHLRPASIDMPLYELYMMDILAFILLCFTGILVVLYFVIRFLFRMICRKCTYKKRKAE